MDYYSSLFASKVSGGGGGITPQVKQALLACFSKVAWIDENGQDYYGTLANALYSTADLVSISAVYNGGSVSATTNLNDLKANLVVTASWSDESTSTIGADYYSLSGTLVEGTSVITASYLGKTATFNVTVTSNYLYDLGSTFVSDGTSRIDTGFAYAKSKTYTMLCDFTPTTEPNSVSYVYGNRASGSTVYIVLQVQKKYLWGMGITYSNGADKSGANKRLRVVSVVAIDSSGAASITAKYKNVTDGGNILTYSNTYSDDYTSVQNVFLGNCENTSTGFIGTINDFKIYDGEMLAADITDYLNNGS